ncbi:Conserved_hypothetical protein [Hexamita inflata]|uniref:Uncharacterized protein n=1 Tax=Hexamita inflata TaxID=28002 RepID=A0AA86N5H4_9EUKA|nr:Conserved hypothetical protein [Hexamita inflata]
MEFTQLFYEQFRLEGTPTDQVLYIYRPVTKGFYFYDILSVDPTELSKQLTFPIASDFDNSMFSSPLSFTELFNFSSLKCNQRLKIFKPVAPPGYKALGCVVAETVSKIPKNILCVQEKMVKSTAGEVIEIFNPFRQTLKLMRNQKLAFDVNQKPEQLIEESDDTEKNKQFFQALEEVKTQNASKADLKEKDEPQLIRERDGLVIRQLPVMQHGKLDEILIQKTVDRDSMTNIYICQQSQQLGDILANTANPVKIVVDSRTSQYYIQQATGFKLIGVSSLSAPTDLDVSQQLQDKERYLYVYEPIPPPGYVAMGLTVSEDLTVSQEVYCVNEKYVCYTTKSNYIGKIYDQETAAYIQEFTQLDDLTEEERKLRLHGLEQPKLNQIQIVQPRQSQYLQIQSDKYPIILPEFNQSLFNQFASQKSILKTLKTEQNVEIVTEFKVYDKFVQVFRSIPKKDSYNTLQYFFKCVPEPNFDIQAEINMLQQQLQGMNINNSPTSQAANVRKPAAGTTSTGATSAPIGVNPVPSNVTSGQNSSLANALPQQVQSFTALPTTQNYPSELTFIDCGAGFDTFAVSEPISFKVLQTVRSTSNEEVHLIQLIPAPGYCSLSDIVHVGSMSTFDKSNFVCVNMCFCQELSLKPHTLIESQFIMAPILPFGTDSLVNSGYLPLRFQSHTGSFLRDQIVQAFYQQEGKSKDLKYSEFSQFDTKLIEQSIQFRNAFDIVSQWQSINQYKLANGQNTMGTAIFENVQDIEVTQPPVDAQNLPASKFDTSKFFQKLLVSSDFQKYSANGLLARPISSLKLSGSINDMSVFKLIAPPGFVALGDVIAKEIDLNQFVCISKSLVQPCYINCPEFALTGFLDTDGIWVYTAPKMLQYLQCFDSPVQNLTFYTLKTSLTVLLQSELFQSVYWPCDEQRSLINPTPFVQYLQNYCSSNRTTLHSQKLNDLGIHTFDSQMVLDPFLSMQKSSVGSLSQFRLSSTCQVLSQEMVSQFLSTSKTKKESVEIQLVSEKMNLLDSLIEMLVNIGYGAELIQFGKPQFYSLKITQYTNEPEQQALPFQTYLFASDKVPISEGGGILKNRPLYFQLFLKFIAKIAGGYKQLFLMAPKQILALVLSMFGFKIGSGKRVFVVYLDPNGTIEVEQAEGREEIIVGI